MPEALQPGVAQVLAARVLARAQELGVHVSVSVADGRGHELLTIRGDGSSWFTPGVARAKAQTAAVMRRDTADVGRMAERFPGLLPLVSAQLAFEPATLPGGVVEPGTDPRWALGVSGALPEQDADCARAALPPGEAGTES
ncbi:MAG: heme-binding protein [Arthrobacter sp.]